MPTATVTPPPAPVAAQQPEVTAWVGATRLVHAKGIAYRDRFNEFGEASFAIQLNSTTATERALLDYDTVVGFHEFGAETATMVVKDIDQVTVATDEETSQVVVYTGPLILGELDGAVVYPATGIHEAPPGPLGGLRLGRAPWSDTVYYNWATPQLDRSSWGSAVEFIAHGQMPPAFPPFGHAGEPEGYPRPATKWIMPSAITSGYHAPRTWYVATTFTSSLCFSVDLFAAAGSNDAFQVWVDGTPMIVADSKDGRKLHRINFGVNDGLHTIVARIEHGGGTDAGNITGFICDVFPHYDDGGGLLFSPFTSTSAAWACLDNPLSPPGFTSTGIVLDLLGQAQDRGSLTAWDTDFTSTTDSAGQAAQLVPEAAFRVGLGLGQAFKQLAEDFGELGYDPTENGGRRLQWWNPQGDPLPGGGTAAGGGTATSVTLAPGVNGVKSMRHRGVGAKFTCLLGRWAEGFVEGPYVEAIAAHGRIEGFYSVPDKLHGPSVAYSVGKRLVELGVPSEAIEGLEHRLRSTTQYRVRDTVTAPTRSGSSTSWRVMERSLSTDADGNGFVTTVLGVARDLWEERLDRWNRKIMGTLDGKSETATVSSPSVITSETVSPAILTFSTGGSGVTLVGDRGTPQRFDGPTVITKLEIETDIAGISGSTTARVEVDGSSIGTVSLASGASEGFAGVSPVLVNRSSWINIETTAAGGAQGITVRVVGCPAI
jgi:hypothetical protein